MITNQEELKIYELLADGKSHKLSEISKYIGRTIKKGELYKLTLKNKNIRFITLEEK